jgi:hypothetical protein
MNDLSDRPMSALIVKERREQAQYVPSTPPPLGGVEGACLFAAERYRAPSFNQQDQPPR